MIIIDAPFLRQVIAQIPCIVVAVFDLDQVYRFVDGPALIDFNLSPGDVVGRKIGDLVEKVHMEIMNDACRRALIGHSVSFELESRGRYYECEVKPFREDGDIVGGLIVTRDISHRKRNDMQRDVFMRTDPLTGLLNRYRFHLLLRRAITRGEPGAVAYLDLDGFKALNDQRGHAVGDVCLKEVADALQLAVRPGDYVARLGGDEFAILFMHTDVAAILGVAARVRCAVFTLPLRASEETGVPPYNIDVSIGTAIWPDHGTTAEEILSRAEAEMYKDKRGRKTSR